MIYHSTRDLNLRASFEQAVMQGLSADGGLFMPAEIRPLPRAFFHNIDQMTLPEVSYAVANYAMQGDLDADVLKRIIDDTISYDMPVVALDDNLNVMELFHGPTMNFKDSGARFLGRVLAYLNSKRGNAGDEINVIVSTSGNTGSAVACGLVDVPGVHVFVLYPQDSLGLLQQAMFTTLGHNVTAIEVNGTVDDCKLLVQQAFADKEINSRMRLTSASATNIARLLPFMFHYFWAYAQLVKNGADVSNLVFSVPCGNLGNLTAGLMAKRMGLPVKRFVAAENENHPFVDYLNSGVFEPMSSVATLAPALDKGNPRNVERIMALYGDDVQALRRDVSGCVVTDELIGQTIRDVYQEHGYVFDTHSAVAYKALQENLRAGECGVALATGHPLKLRAIVERITGTRLEIPESVAPLRDLAQQIVHINSGFNSLKQYLLTR